MSKIFTNVNLKNTKGREVVLETIKKASLPISAEDIYKIASKKMAINLSTVYRTLATLCKKNVLISQIMHDKKTYYQINNLSHKHILVCELCHSKIPIEDCPIHTLEDKIQAETGFKIHSHTLEISGVCLKCQQKEQKNSK